MMYAVMNVWCNGHGMTYRRLASFLEHVKKNNQDEGGVLYRLDDDAIHTGLDINKAH